ncbi:MAG: hypothetical protein AAFO29_25135, partial [Actinomycetota bacterium]
QVDDLDAHRERLSGTELRVVFEADGPGIRGIHLHPADVGGAIVSIDQNDPPEAWGWAGLDWAYHAASSVVDDLVAVDIQADDPADLASRWSLALDRPIDGDGNIPLDDGVIRFVPATDGRGDGLAAADLVAVDRSRAGQSFEICGTRFNLV